MAGLSVWTTYSQAGNDGNQAWFALYGGNVVVKNPDEEIRKKMHSIAQRLSAKVQGDEGECYGPDGTPISVATGHRFSGVLGRWFGRGPTE
ncbi:MAG TPA: hypothetical protein VFW44_03655 [Bryobacteraceae bacterium]|nr:hypothetical protein [Bryobacteraceae bacterium]